MEYYEDGDYYYTEEEECDDDEIEEYYESSEESELLEPHPLVNLDEQRTPVQWKTVTVGRTTLSVSNEGKIMISPFYITTGDREIGTPYRYIQVCSEDGIYINHYVHDIVWRAFKNEDVFDGWEVRHFDYTEMDSGKCYINNLENLHVYPNTVSREIHLLKNEEDVIV
jgi:hypothetical protein